MNLLRIAAGASALLAGARGAEPPLALYFPPAPPVLWAQLPGPGATSPPAASAALAPFVADPFYAPLGCQVQANELGSDLQYALQSYQNAKAALQTELHARLDTLRDSTPADRVAALKRFAAEQTPRIAKLEAEGERLRADLCHRTAAHRQFVRWTIDTGSVEPSPGPSSAAIWRQEAYISAYFAGGPSPGQRRLLREIAVERGPDFRPEAGAFFFSPAGAELGPVSVENAPAGLRAEIADYIRIRSALKASLAHLLTTSDRFKTDAWAAADREEAPIEADLRDRADRIREGLAKLKDPSAPPALPPHGAQLEAEIAAYHKEKSALQHAVLERVEAAKKAGSDVDAPERIRQAVADFTRENQDRYDALGQAKERIRTELSNLPAPPAKGASDSADTLARSFSASLRKLQLYWNYRDYQAAVLQPGLSPEQRRLLFDEALVKLALPLPDPERPIGVPPS